MAVTQYIGARYVPLFADPLEWVSNKTYEPLTIVVHNGNSYTSRQYVPKGIDIDDDKFWALTGNYNAQVERYRDEVKQFDNRIETNKKNIDANASDIAANASDIAANASDIAANASDIANINGFLNRSPLNDTIIIFGDSWTANRQNEPTTITRTFTNIMNKLHYKVFLYGESGAGFVNRSMFTGLTIDDQITQCANDSKVDKDKIAAIIVIAGCNDVYHNRDGGNAAAERAISRIISTFKITPFVIPNVTTPGCIWNYSYAKELYNGVSIYSNNTIKRINFTLLHASGGSGIYSDSRHLKDTAQTTLGYSIANALLYGDELSYYTRNAAYLNFISDEGVNYITGTVNTANSYISVHFTPYVTDTHLLKFTAGSGFSENSSDSPEYTKGTMPSFKFVAYLEHQNGTNTIQIASTKAPNDLVLATAPESPIMSAHIQLLI